MTKDPPQTTVELVLALLDEIEQALAEVRVRAAAMKRNGCDHD